MVAASTFANSRFNLNPTVTLTSMYNTNIRLATVNPEGDLLTIISPSIQSTTLLRFGEFAFSYSPNLFLFASNLGDENLDLTSHDALVSLLVHLTGRLDFELSDTFTAATANIGRPESVPNNIVHVNTIRAKFNYSLPLSQRTETLMSLEGARSDVFDFNSDRFSLVANVDILREFTPRLRGGLGNRGVWILYDDATLNDVLIYAVDGHLEYDFSERFTVKLPVGVQVLMQQGNSASLGASVDLKATYRIAEFTDAVFKAKRGFTVDAQGNSFEQWEFSLEYLQALTKRLQATTGVRWLTYSNTINSINAGDDVVLEGSIKLEYEWRPNLTTFIGTRLFLNRGELSGNDLDVFHGFLGVSYDFSKN